MQLVHSSTPDTALLGYLTTEANAFWLLRRRHSATGKGPPLRLESASVTVATGAVAHGCHCQGEAELEAAGTIEVIMIRGLGAWIPADTIEGTMTTGRLVVGTSMAAAGQAGTGNATHRCPPIEEVTSGTVSCCFARSSPAVPSLLQTRSRCDACGRLERVSRMGACWGQMVVRWDVRHETRELGGCVPAWQF
jgi:hypothetical protein